MKYGLTFISILFVITSFAQTRITANEAIKKLNSSKIQLLDVRTEEEFNKKHIKNAVNINWADKTNFEVQTANLSKKKPIYIYCLSGGRSTKAASYLSKKGFKVYEIEGGILSWESENLPLEKPTQEFSDMDESQYLSIIKNHNVVLVDFYAEWCGPCKELNPIIDQIAKKYKNNIKIIKINTDNNGDLVKELGVRNIPQIYIYKDGKKSWSHIGLVDFETIDKHLN